MTISTEEFLELISVLDHADLPKRANFWNHVSSIASKDGTMRVVLEKQLPKIKKFINADIDSKNEALIDSLVFALGYCVARPQLSKHLELQHVLQNLTRLPRTFSFNRPICIKCIWALANVKDMAAVKEASVTIVSLIADMTRHHIYKEDVTVQKEVLRLIDKMLLTTPSLMCNDTHLVQWLLHVVNLTTNKLQLIRDKALDVLKTHIHTMIKIAEPDINKMMTKHIFTLSSSQSPPSGLFRELQELILQQHGQHVIHVWVLLVQMTSKCIRKKRNVNELFTIPKFYVSHLEDDKSCIALLKCWIHVIDIYRRDNPELLCSKDMKFFMSPFFLIKSDAIAVSCAAVCSWWYLAVACHRLGYVNNFNTVLEPCLKKCFKSPGAGLLVEQGAQILLLLLDSPHPDTELVAIAPSPLNLNIQFHCATFMKYFTLLIRYNPKCSALIIPIWGSLCDCVKGIPDMKTMLSVLEQAIVDLSPLTAVSMIETLNSSSVMSAAYKSQLARHLVQCDISEDKIAHHITKLLKTVSYTDSLYLRILSDILLYIDNPENVSKKSPKYLCKIWESVSERLVHYIREAGCDMNEGTRISPQFHTTQAVVEHVFTLLQKPMQQDTLREVCEKWETLFSLYCEQTSQYANITTHVTERYVTLVLDTYIEKLLPYSLVYITKVLIEESPVPKLTLLHSSTPDRTLCPIFRLVARVLHLAHSHSSEKTGTYNLPTLLLLFDMLACSWRLLTPGQVTHVLWSISLQYTALAGLPNIQTPATASFTALLDTIQRQLTFYGSEELRNLQNYIIFGLTHRDKPVRLFTAKFWNSTFGLKDNVTYSPEMRTVLQKEARRSALIVPSAMHMAVPQATTSQSQTSDPAPPPALISDCPVKGSFLGKNTKSAPQPTTRQPPNMSFEVPKTRSLTKRMISEDSKECVYISTSPKKQKILTKHQKEKIREQRFDRTVPVMYNSLDINSQEPLSFSNDTQDTQSCDTQDYLPKSPVTPGKELSPPKPATPGGGFRKLLFLSPLPNKATLNPRSSAVSKALATLPLSSPNLTSQSDVQTQSDSDEELFCDPPESPSQCPKSPPSEETSNSPPTDREYEEPGRALPITQSTVPSISNTHDPDSLLSTEGSTEESGREESQGGSEQKSQGRLSSLYNTVMGFISTPSHLPLMSDNCPTTESSDECLTSKDTTPVDSALRDVTASFGPRSLKLTLPTDIWDSGGVKSGDSTSSSKSDTDINAVVLVEDSQAIDTLPSFNTEFDSIVPYPSTQNETSSDPTVPNLEEFSVDISPTDCSTARGNTSNVQETEDNSNSFPPRRSSRKLIKRTKSQDYDQKESQIKFRKIKSSDDITQPRLNSVLPTVKEVENSSPLRKSSRPRKFSEKIRDTEFITEDMPLSLLVDNSSRDSTGDTLKEAVLSPDVQIVNSPSITPNHKKRRGRPPRNQTVPSKRVDIITISSQDPESVITASILTREAKIQLHDDVNAAMSRDIPLVTIPDTQPTPSAILDTEPGALVADTLLDDIVSLEPDEVIRDYGEQSNAQKHNELEKSLDVESIPDTQETTISDSQPETVEKSIVSDCKDDGRISESIPDSQVQTEQEISQSKIQESSQIDNRGSQNGNSILDSQVDSNTKKPKNPSRKSSRFSDPASEESPQNQIGRPKKSKSNKTPSRKSSRLSDPPSEGSPQSQITSYFSKTTKQDKESNNSQPSTWIKFTESPDDSDETQKPSDSSSQATNDSASQESCEEKSQRPTQPTDNLSHIPKDDIPEKSLDNTSHEPNDAISQNSLDLTTPKQDDTKSQIPEISSSQKESKSEHVVVDSDEVQQSKSSSENVQLSPNKIDDSRAAKWAIVVHDKEPIVIDENSAEVQQTQTLSENEPPSSQPSSQRTRTRKQAKPRKSAGPSRKSSRLTSRHMSQTKTEDSSKVLVPDSDSPELESPPSEIDGKSFVKDSVSSTESTLDTTTIPTPNVNQVPDSLTIMPSQESPVKSQETEILEKWANKSVEDKVIEVLADSQITVFSQDISLEITSSNMDILDSNSPSTSDRSTDSVETFGRAVLDPGPMTPQPCTPLPGLATQEDVLPPQIITPSQLTPENQTNLFKVQPAENKKDETELIVVSDTVQMTENKQGTIEVSTSEDNSVQDTTSLHKSQEITSKKYTELDEFEEPDTSKTFCENSQLTTSQSVLVPAERLLEVEKCIVRQSQTLEFEFNNNNKRSLRRKQSIPSNLDEVMQDWVDVESSQTNEPQTTECPQIPVKADIKTPPKTLHIVGEEAGSPHTPQTPTSILKKARTPGSGSQAKRHVSFGPLPESHTATSDPNETTPRRHSKYRKSPAAACKKITCTAEDHTPPPVEEPIYPTLVHCTVQAHDIIKKLCYGFGNASILLNLSMLAAKNIKTIGDLARLTPSEVDKLPFINPKVIQIKRYLKKYESTQSPMSFKHRDIQQMFAGKPTDKLQTNPVQTNPVQTNPVIQEKKSAPIEFGYFDENKENIAPNNEDAPKSGGTKHPPQDAVLQDNKTILSVTQHIPDKELDVADVGGLDRVLQIVNKYKVVGVAQHQETPSQTVNRHLAPIEENPSEVREETKEKQCDVMEVEEEHTPLQTVVPPTTAGSEDTDDTQIPSSLISAASSENAEVGSKDDTEHADAAVVVCPDTLTQSITEQSLPDKIEEHVMNSLPQIDSSRQALGALSERTCDVIPADSATPHLSQTDPAVHPAVESELLVQESVEHMIESAPSLDLILETNVADHSDKLNPLPAVAKDKAEVDDTIGVEQRKEDNKVGEESLQHGLFDSDVDPTRHSKLVEYPLTQEALSFDDDLEGIFSKLDKISEPSERLERIFELQSKLGDKGREIARSMSDR